jgi:hypothetical protein
MSASFSGLLFDFVPIHAHRGAKVFRDRSAYCGCQSFLVATGRNLMLSPSAHSQLIHELPKSEMRYRALAGAAFDAIVAIAPDGVVQ